MVATKGKADAPGASGSLRKTRSSKSQDAANGREQHEEVASPSSQQKEDEGANRRNMRRGTRQAGAGKSPKKASSLDTGLERVARRQTRHSAPQQLDAGAQQAQRADSDDEKEEEHSDSPKWTRRTKRIKQQLKRASLSVAHDDEDDEVQDEDGEGSSGDDEPVIVRYARRQRQTTQRFSPGRDEPTRRNQPHGNKRRTTESEDDDLLSDEDDYQEEQDKQLDNRPFAERYPTRNRSQLKRYQPNSLEEEPGQRKRGRTHANDSESEEEEEDVDDSDEDDEEAGEGDEEGGAGHRYPLRDRSRIMRQADPLLGSGRPDKATVQKKLEKLSARASRRRHASRRSHRSWDEEDDIPDTDSALPWRALQPAGTPGAGAGGGLTPGKLAAGAGGGGQPWDVGMPMGGGRDRSGTNAEITPLEVDPSVTFDQVGGLDHYIKALKEMIFLPLVYPELFERFHIAPPRGVLFYGPPGTGKTLVARALAASASRAGRKVSFFMRKGADVLSKWVGEAERQLKLLFEEAQKAQPAIIFFDEIDGLAPVRSSKQDQIHNSIVSTLLALMDGLDSRGKVVIIGATNRIDALDGALRRPGRFDRELVFPLPNLPARASIVDIHTRKWAEPPPPELREELARMCVGYCGADLKALCTEASLHALRRQYPQIYESDDKLLIDPASVKIGRRDFLSAFTAITPASHRSAAAHARPLSGMVAPCLQLNLDQILDHLRASFPPAASCLEAAEAQAAGGAPSGRPGPASNASAAASFLYADDDEEDDDSAALSLLPGLRSTSALHVQRPRLLVCGPEGGGQGHLGPAVLYALEGLPVHAIGLPSLLSDASARSPEEAVVHAVVEARRAAPAVLYLPHLQLWWDTAPASLRATLWMLLADLPPDLPLLLFATADTPLADLNPEALQLFGALATGAHELGPPGEAQRAEFFDSIASALALPPQPVASRRAQAPPPVLPKAPEAIAAQQEAEAAAVEAKARAQHDEDQAVLRTLRMALRDVATRMLCDRRWRSFAEPVSPDEDPEYWEKVSNPMDLATLLARVDGRAYATAAAFLRDVALIPVDAAQYYGHDIAAVKEVSRAHALEDEARGLVAACVPPELAAKCDAIITKGGPAPLPGVEVEDEPVRPLVLGGWPVEDRGGREADGAAGSSGAGVRARSSARLRGAELDGRVVYDDPDAMMRTMRSELRKAGLAPDKRRARVAFSDQLDPLGEGRSSAKQRRLSAPPAVPELLDKAQVDRLASTLGVRLRGRTPRDSGETPTSRAAAPSRLAGKRAKRDWASGSSAKPSPQVDAAAAGEVAPTKTAAAAQKHAASGSAARTGQAVEDGAHDTSLAAVDAQTGTAGTTAAAKVTFHLHAEDQGTPAISGRSPQDAADGTPPFVLGETPAPTIKPFYGAAGSTPYPTTRMPGANPMQSCAVSHYGRQARFENGGMQTVHSTHAGGRAQRGDSEDGGAVEMTWEEEEEAADRADYPHTAPHTDASTRAQIGAGSRQLQGQEASTRRLPQPADLERAAALKRELVRSTAGLLCEPLEAVHARLSRIAHEQRRNEDREAVVQQALQAVQQCLKPC
ncbi:hypothetical protein WJX72_012131 [[Myrmecia] bisecta]|uniref:Bromo domain-containing protein n=1 Tax=[Myrmecia] bisecta TaxID=41462 RepID=A0AAW1PQ04_9CHLO